MSILDEVIIREYKEGDEVQINLLHNQQYGTNRSAEEWRWEFRNGPYGESIFVVAEHNGEIIGTQAQLPTLLSYGPKEILSAKTEATHLKKGYRGQGILERLHDKGDELAAKRGITLFWGIDKKNVAKSHMRSHYQIVGSVGYLALILNPSQSYQIYKDKIPADVKKRIPVHTVQKLLLRVFTQVGSLWFKAKRRKINLSPGFDVVQISKPDDRLDAFWEAFRLKGKFFTIARTGSYLEWRIFRNPYTSSQILAAIKDNDIQGYIIISKNKNENVGSITDFCVRDEHFEKVSGLLISHAIEHLNSQGVALVDAWHAGNHHESKKYLSWLKKGGFLPLPIRSCIIHKVLAEAEGLPAESMDLDQWFITALFSDV